MRKWVFIFLFIGAVSISSYQDYKSENSEAKKTESKKTKSQCEGLLEGFTRKQATELVNKTEANFEEADMLKRRAKHFYKIGQLSASEYRRAKEYKRVASDQRMKAYIYAQKLEDCYKEIAEIGLREIARIKSEQDLK